MGQFEAQMSQFGAYCSCIVFKISNHQNLSILLKIHVITQFGLIQPESMVLPSMQQYAAYIRQYAVCM